MTDPRVKAVPVAWAGLMGEWTDGLRAAGLSRETVALRRAHVAQLARALGSSPGEVTRAALVEWLGSRDWQRETRRAVRSSLRSWWRHVGRPELADAVPIVRPGDVRPRPLPDEALTSALMVADERVTLMLRLAAEAGLRRGEIARIHASDLGTDLLGAVLRVRGKGAKERTVPIGAGLAAAVRLRAKEGWLFPGADHGHLSPRWVGKLMSKTLPEGWTPHTLRHRFASRAYGATSDVVGVSRLLGHASVATTQRYVATDADRLRRIAAAAA